MKLISLLIALVIVGFLVKTQLDSSSSNAEYDEITNNTNIEVPKVPTAPKDVQKFEKDMNQFMDDAADKRAKEIDESVDY